MKEYSDQFELVSRSRREMDREVLMGTFLNGLKEEFQAELKFHDFQTHFQLMDEAVELEERNLVWKMGGLMI